MLISTFDTAHLHDVLGIDMSSIDGLSVGAGWARVRPGARSAADRHDEAEVLVIVHGMGDLIVNGGRHPLTAGTVAMLEPFETHVVENTGAVDLVFVTFYWRDHERISRALGAADHRHFGDRPVFVFSTPPTPNGDLHLGHLSGPYLGADVFVRFQRLNGTAAWHLTGSDDFQSYTLRKADQEGREPAATAAHYSAEILQTLRMMDIVPDQYTVSNGDAAYPAGLRRYFSRLAASEAVTRVDGPALFDGVTGEYLYEVDVSGECPSCGNASGGNICEECGEPNTCVDLVSPKSMLSQASPKAGRVARFSIPLHEFGDVVASHHRLGRVPARIRELADRVFKRTPLDIALTHPSSWGVPSAEGPDGQVIWAWPEMAYGFLHGIEALGRRMGRRWTADSPQGDWKIVHFFGFDNSFYHTILYPSLYRLAYPDWAPDIDYHVNEFYLLDGGKFSTSRRHAIWGKEILTPDSVDAVRFFLARTRPEAERTNFQLHAYESVLRTTLVGTWQLWLNDLGDRLATRYGGHAPDAGIWTPEHVAFAAALKRRLAALTASLGADGFSLNRAALELEGIVTDATRFAAMESATADIERWQSESRTAIALELAAAWLLARCAAPVMPRFAEHLASALGQAAPANWPDTVNLIPPRTPVDLATEIFFTLPAAVKTSVRAA